MDETPNWDSLNRDIVEGIYRSLESLRARVGKDLTEDAYRSQALGVIADFVDKARCRGAEYMRRKYATNVWNY